MGPVRTVIAVTFGGAPVLAAGLLLLAGAKAWSVYERRRSDRRLVRLLGSDSADVRRYAVRSVADPSRHAATLLRYRLIERDNEILGLLAQHVRTCRWSRSQSPDWLTLRLWAFAFGSPNAVASEPLAPDDPWYLPAAETERVPARAAAGRRGPVLGSLALDLGIVAGLVYATWIVGSRSGAFTGFPKGYDAYAHLITIRLILHNFPHFLWNYAWYGGFPAYPGSYPPIYSLFVSAGVTASGATIVQAMDVATAVMYSVAIASLYGFVRVLGRNRLIAVATAVVLLSAPALWSASLHAGSYTRLCAMALGDLASLLAAADARRPTRIRAVGIVVLLGLSMASHPVIGILMVFQVACILTVAAQAPFEQRMRRLAMVLAGVAGLSAWYYLPYFIHPSAYYLQAPQPALVTGMATQFRTLLVVPTGTQHATSALVALPAVLVPLVVAVGVWIALLVRRPRRARGTGLEESSGQPWRERRGRLSHPLGVAAALLVPVAGCLAYAFLPHIHGLRLTIDGVFSPQMLSYAVWPLAAALGVAACGVVSLFPPWGARQLVGAVMVLLAAGCAVVSVPLFAPAALSDGGPVQTALIAATPTTHNTLDERIAGTGDTATRWSNVVTDTPIERDDFAQGILNIDYQAFADDALNEASFSHAQRAFVIDWYAIEWLYAQTGPTANEFYGSQPANYKLLENISGTPDSTYEVRHPSPVLSATSAPAVLVVGSPENYSLVFGDLALGDVGSASLIPVQGTQYIDDYSLTELEQFPTVLCYGFSAHNAVSAAHLLDAYVRHGGRLVMDVAGDTSLAAVLAAAAPRAFPAGLWGALEVSRDWQFRALAGPLTAGVRFSRFGPALFGTFPWLAEVAEHRRPGSSVVLDTNGQPLVVDGRDGAGTVVMSGMNLPFHAASYRNAGEVGFLVRLIEGRPPRPATGPGPRYRVRFEGADAVAVQVRSGPVSGVLYKEEDYPDWHAMVNGVEAPIYPAGPAMIYVPIARGAPDQVRIFYRLSHFEYASTGISLVTIVLLGLYVVVPEALRRSVLERLWRRRRTRAPRHPFAPEVPARR
jgi:hypothetical protein